MSLLCNNLHVTSLPSKAAQPGHRLPGLGKYIPFHPGGCAEGSGFPPLHGGEPNSLRGCDPFPTGVAAQAPAVRFSQRIRLLAMSGCSCGLAATAWSPGQNVMPTPVMHADHRHHSIWAVILESILTGRSLAFLMVSCWSICRPGGAGLAGAPEGRHGRLHMHDRSAHRCRPMAGRSLMLQRSPPKRPQ